MTDPSTFDAAIRTAILCILIEGRPTPSVAADLGAAPADLDA
jgi:hypothetical protein